MQLIWLVAHLVKSHLTLRRDITGMLPRASNIDSFNVSAEAWAVGINSGLQDMPTTPSAREKHLINREQLLDEFSNLDEAYERC